MPQPSITQRDAEWAQMFQNSTSSLAQRQRYAEARQTGRDASDREDAIAFEQAQLRDPELGRLMLGRQREERLGFQAEDARGFRERDFAFRQNRAAQQDALAAEKFNLDVTKASLAERRALREMKDAARIEAETDALEQASFDLREAGVMPGSEGYAAGMAAAAIANPYARSDLRKSIFADARIDHDADEFLAEANRIGMKNPKLSVRAGPDGRMVYGVSEGAAPKDEAPASPDKELDDALKDWKDALTMRAKMTERDDSGKEIRDRPAAGYSAEDQLAADMLKERAAKRVAELRGKSAPAASPASPAQGPAQTKTLINPENGEKVTLVLKDGQWQPQQ